MQTQRNITFDEMPVLMADMVLQLRTLTDMVDKLSHAKPERTSGKFVPSHKNLLTTHQLCKLLGKDRHAIYRLVAAGEIPYVKQGKNLFFFEDEVYQWLEDHRRCSGHPDENELAAREYIEKNKL